jgi:uncharacterized GH25 family protein
MRFLPRTLPRLTAALALACAATLPAQAHNAWLLPSATVLSKADWITVDAAVSNDLFFFNHVPLNLQNLQITAPDGSALQPQNLHQGKLRNVFDLQLQQPGTYRIATVNSGLFASYKDAEGKPKRWRGSPEKFATDVPADAKDLQVTQSVGRIETFVTLGKPSALQASGQGMELLAADGQHLNDLVAGETSQLRLLVDGQPAANVEVSIVAGASRYRDSLNEINVTTDAQGNFSITWPAAGAYWLEASHKDNKTSLPQAKERRLTYVATLEVLP